MMMHDVWLILLWAMAFAGTVIAITSKVKLNDLNTAQLIELFARIAVNAAEQVGNYEKLSDAEKYTWAVEKFNSLCSGMKIDMDDTKAKAYLENAVYKQNIEDSSW